MNTDLPLPEPDATPEPTVRLRNENPTPLFVEASAESQRNFVPGVTFKSPPHLGAQRERRSPLAELEAGSQLFDFRLLSELGAGAFARVFLAQQIGLAQRLVVLKISNLEGNEPQTLAQLQHTHIVPIYSLHEDHVSSLRALCMPYFGGAALSRVLDVLRELPAWPEDGRPFEEALRQVAPPESGANPKSDPASTTRKRTTMTQTALEVVASLAEGLEHAHRRGVRHRDIKPSNILIAHDGQPLLLDFNVSQNLADDPTHATLGGTIAYASPEHLHAMTVLTQVAVRRVDERSDIYSLGIVLYEMLTGASPFEHAGSYRVHPDRLQQMIAERGSYRPSLRHKNPRMPWSLESIVRRCLAPNPEDRYQHAEELAEDLRRHLLDLPLQHAKELSWRERGAKWVRRHPKLTFLTAASGLAAAFLICAALLIHGLQGTLAETQATLQVARNKENREQFEAGALRATCLLNTVTDLRDHRDDGLQVCRETLDLYEKLDGPDRTALASQARELLLLYAWGRVREGGRSPAALREGLDLLAKAEAVEGLEPSPALWQDRASYLERLGDKALAAEARAKAEKLPPKSAQDHYLLAAALARRGGSDAARQAVVELDRVLALQPRHYWALLQRGIALQDLGDNDLALADFSTCVGLWPDFAWSYFNRGVILARGGKKPEALRDFSAALERDPKLVVGYFNRGLLHLEMKQFEPALADFDKVASLTAPGPLLLASRAVALEGTRQHDEADKTFAAAFSEDGRLSESEERRLHWVYGFAVSKRLPDKAKAAFDRVLRLDPRQPQSLYGRAMLAVDAEELNEALRFIDRAIDADPTFVDARRSRAIIQARRGEIARAGVDINWCLEREPTNGVTLYAAACVASRAGLFEQGFDFLKKAFDRGYGREQAGHDPDLETLRSRAEWLAATR